MATTPQVAAVTAAPPSSRVTAPRNGGRPGEVQYAPHRWTGPVPPALPLPPLMLCEVVPTGGGEFRLRPLLDQWVPLHRFLKAMGRRHQDRSIRRLATAGFIRSRELTHGILEIHLPSFHAHCAAVEADPEFWENEANIKRWRQAL